MQKLTKSLSEHLPPVKLFLDDLEQIVEILQEVSKKVKISTNDYAFEDLKELVNKKYESINKLHISISDPYVSLDLESYGISLYIEKDEPISRGLFEKIKQILIQRKRPFGWLLTNWYLAGIFAGISIPLLIIGIEKNISSFIILGIIPFGCIAAIWTVYGLRNQSKSNSIIIPKYKNEAPSFIKRNSDKIILIIFSALAGGIITFLVEKWIVPYLR